MEFILSQTQYMLSYDTAYINMEYGQDHIFKIEKQTTEKCPACFVNSMQCIIKINSNLS